MQSSSTQVAVIGGGITGLCCAHRLHSLGLDVLLLEGSTRLGGRIRTVAEGGFEFEAGPNTLLGNSPELTQLIEELGIRSSVVQASPEAKRRYVLYHGQLKPVPMGPISAITSPLLGIAGLAGVAGDLYRRRPATTPSDETVASFVRRRFGARVLDNLVAPFLSGVYAGDPEQLEARSVLKKLVAAEDNTGSVIRGMIRARRHGRKPGEPRRPMTSITFRGGLSALPFAVAKVLGERVRTGSRVQRIDPSGDGCRLALDDGQTVDCSRVAIASETSVAAGLVETLPRGAEIAADLRAIPSSGVAVVGFAFERSAVAHPLDGFGFLSGPGTKGPLLGCLFRSSIFPETAPKGSVLLVCFLGGARHDLSALSDDRIVQTARTELNTLLGIAGEPRRVFFQRWAQAIPQFVQGHAERAKRITRWSADSPVSVISSGVHGVALPLCIATGRSEADRLASALSSAPARPQEVFACR